MKKMIVVMMVATLSVTGLFATPVAESTKEELVPQCTINISGTYDNKQININITVEATNCAKAAGELLKAALSQK